jgi:outer membrane protein assembly factor BamE (lipoprotein component of BamABCDE complex)
MIMKNIFSLLILLLLISCGVQQNLTVSYRLNDGMTKSEVKEIMGAPIKSDFYKNVDEWFYCKTGQMSDEHLALFFYDGKLVAKKNYSVTGADTRGMMGSCEKFIKMGNYRVPDLVVEIRNR